MNFKYKIFRFIFFIALSIWQDVVIGQVGDSLKFASVADSTIQLNEKGKFVKGNFSKFRLRPYILPGALFTYGLIAPSIKVLHKIDIDVRKKIVLDNPHPNTHIDNYLQYTPALAVYALNLAGKKGKNNFRDRSMILVMSHVFTTVSVQSIKYISKRMRPDGSENNSFPSGHTAEAFSNATFLFYEYRHKSIWYGVVGYAAAATTGYLRMYNNKHWLSDIIAGAGVGIASTTFSYWLYPKMSNYLFNTKNANTVLLPSYNNGNFCMNFIRKF